MSIFESRTFSLVRWGPMMCAYISFWMVYLNHMVPVTDPIFFGCVPEFRCVLNCAQSFSFSHISFAHLEGAGML